MRFRLYRVATSADVVVFAWLATALAALPLLMAWRNLPGFTRPVDAPPAATGVSILLPARNEAADIERAVRAALASRGVAIEVIVLDDDSNDDTGAIVARIAAEDPRLRLLRPPPLPPGWAGKQRACHLMSEAARHDVLMFVDVDVRLQPDAAARAAARLLAEPRLGMVSGFPREITVGLAEKLVIPWIHVLLLGYLPMARMRRTSVPSYAAACGQWIVARRAAYRAVGGHAATPSSRHDGTSLPRTFRIGGWRTDVFDGSTLASCRMYDRFGAVWRGFAKNPGEGMTTALALPVWTVLIGAGHVAPWLLLVAGLATRRSDLWVPAACGVVANLSLRSLLCVRLGLSRVGAVLHPLGASLMLVNQWAALLGHRLGRPSTWRGRHYVAPPQPGAR